MKNYTKLLFQRVVVVSFCIAIQAVFLILGIGVLSGYYRWFSIVMEVLSWIAGDRHCFQPDGSRL